MLKKTFKKLIKIKTKKPLRLRRMTHVCLKLRIHTCANFFFKVQSRFQSVKVALLPRKLGYNFLNFKNTNFNLILTKKK